MQLTRLLAAAVVGLLAAHPSPSQDAQTDPDPTVAGGGALRASGRAQTDAEHNLDAHIALAGHRR